MEREGNFTVYRSQLPKKNKFYSDLPPVEEGCPLPEITAGKKLCHVCGCLGPSSCSRCRKVNYCSVKHQQVHWPYHKKNCSTEILNETENFVFLPRIMLPEMEIVIDSNCTDVEDESDIDDEESEKRRLEEYKNLEEIGKTGTLKDVPDSHLDKYASETEAADDKFWKFKKEINNYPDQILRYKRGGTPLWVADVEKTIMQQLKIPHCELCGSERNFEFQIMPQMLNLLKDDYLDWGTLAVYTCSISCIIPTHKSYVLEYIVRQDII